MSPSFHNRSFEYIPHASSGYFDSINHAGAAAWNALGCDASPLLRCYTTLKSLRGDINVLQQIFWLKIISLVPATVLRGLLRSHGTESANLHTWSTFGPHSVKPLRFNENTKNRFVLISAMLFYLVTKFYALAKYYRRRKALGIVP